MLFRISKIQARLFYSTALFAFKSGDFNNQFDLLIADRYCFKCTCHPAKPDDIVRFTVWALKIITVDRTVKNGLAVKKTVLMC